MNIFDCFPSKYLKAGDLQGQTVELTIVHIGIEELEDDERRPIVHFEEATKGLLLNRTNAKTIADLYGPETDVWRGRKIALFPTTTDYRGQTVDCIRVRPPKPAAPVDQPEATFRRRPNRQPVGIANGAAGLDL